MKEYVFRQILPLLSISLGNSFYNIASKTKTFPFFIPSFGLSRKYIRAEELRQKRKGGGQIKGGGMEARGDNTQSPSQIRTRI